MFQTTPKMYNENIKMYYILIYFSPTFLLGLAMISFL
jgi:hypothetical protein